MYLPHKSVYVELETVVPTGRLTQHEEGSLNSYQIFISDLKEIITFHWFFSKHLKTVLICTLTNYLSNYALNTTCNIKKLVSLSLGFVFLISRI